MSMSGSSSTSSQDRYYQRFYAEYEASEVEGRSSRGAKKRKGHLPNSGMVVDDPVPLIPAYCACAVHSVI